MQIIVVHNKKGGVGKTTTTQHLAIAISKIVKSKILLIDLDSQSNLTSVFNVSSEKYNTATLFRNLMQDYEKVKLKDYITKINNEIDIVCASNDLSLVQNEIAHFSGKSGFLLDDIRNQFKSYDYILTDTPPQAGWLVTNALILADKILCPISCETFSIEGLHGFSEDIKRLSKENRKNIKISIIVPTLFDKRRTAHKDLLIKMKRSLGSIVSKTIIRIDANIESAQAEALSVFEYAEKTRAVKDYTDLAKEIIKTRYKTKRQFISI